MLEPDPKFRPIRRLSGYLPLEDLAKGGHFSVTPEGLLEARQRYETDTAVLTTEVRTATGLVRITDALVLRSRADPPTILAGTVRGCAGGQRPYRREG